jgi:hypothetical protein
MAKRIVNTSTPFRMLQQSLILQMGSKKTKQIFQDIHFTI